MKSTTDFYAAGRSITGYIATRGPGLPDAMADKGAWTEQLGVIKRWVCFRFDPNT